MPTLTARPSRPPCPPLPLRQALPLALAAVAAFHLAYAHRALSALIVVYLYCLLRLAWTSTWRQAFLLGLGAGFACFAPRLAFFWTIFGPAAIDFWLLLALWVALFVVLVRAIRVRLGPFAAIAAAPFLWTGLEFFRSEVYYLRFSWLSAGYVFSDAPLSVHLDGFGVYGIGFLLMAAAAVVHALHRRWVYIAGAAALAASALFLNGNLAIWRQWGLPGRDTPAPYVIGIQMEFPDEDEVLAALDEAVRANPGVDILVMSEYTFAGPVPERVRQWCKARRKYLIAGGKDPISGTDDFYNTAFVIGPEGEVAFKQAKSVPIQFFKDGLPAQEQRLWQSPRGAIGLCICYDLSYTRVTDRLVRMGARALIVPTMDMENWGAAQHWLHSRIASVRAAEYRLPVFRVCSSGVSQAVSERGQVHAFASVGAHGATISDMLELRMAEGGHVPWDRRLAPLCVAVAALVGLWLAVERSLGWSRRRRSR